MGRSQLGVAGGPREEGGLSPGQDWPRAFTAAGLGPAPQTSHASRRLLSRLAMPPSATSPRAGTVPHQGGGRSPAPRGCLQLARPGGGPREGRPRPARGRWPHPIALAPGPAQARRPLRDTSPASSAPAAPAQTSRPHG